MAEGWATHLAPDSMEAYSAGTDPQWINQNAVRVMAEAGVDIAGQRSKHVDELKAVSFDYVVTLCDQAHETCPLFHGKARLVHVGFDDPPLLAKTAKTDEEAIRHYRRVRDEIRELIEHFDQRITAFARHA